MSCTRNRIVYALAASITGFLQEAYTAESKCYLHHDEKDDPPGADSLTISPSRTPAVWLEEVASILTDSRHSDYDRVLDIVLHGVIKYNTINVDAGTIQQQLNELEVVLDRCLNESAPLDSIASYVAPNGRCESSAVELDATPMGVIRYPIKVGFARLGGGTT